MREFINMYEIMNEHIHIIFFEGVVIWIRKKL